MIPTMPKLPFQPIVGQPILAAAAFQAALSDHTQTFLPGDPGGPSASPCHSPEPA
jgi:hypothetical protein